MFRIFPRLAGSGGKVLFRETIPGVSLMPGWSGGGGRCLAIDYNYGVPWDHQNTNRTLGSDKTRFDVLTETYYTAEENSEQRCLARERLREAFEPDTPLSVEEWESLKQGVLGLPLEDNKIITKVNVDNVILRSLVECGAITVARSYYQYRNRDNRFRLSQMEPLLKLFSRCPLKDEGEFVIEISNKFLDMGYDNLVPHLFWNSIEALSRTSEWEKSLSLAFSVEKDPQYNESGSVQAFSALAIRALAEKRIDLMWKILDSNQFHQDNIAARQPLHVFSAESHERLFCAWIEHCATVRSADGSKMANTLLHQLFSYLRKQSMHVGVRTRDKLEEYFRQEGEGGVRVEYTRIKASTGRCIKCSTKLSENCIEPDDFHKLKSCVLDNVITKKDVWQTSSPEELASFLQLLDREVAGFDIVVDGLNTALVRTPGLGSRHKPLGMASSNLLQTVRHFHALGLRILVIHRIDVRRYPHYLQLMEMATVLELSKVTSDDPYMLVAALHSGPTCRIVSNDLLRQHSVLLARVDPAIAKLFTKWQIAHQIYVTGYEEDRTGKFTGPPRLIHPPQHSIEAVEDGGYWHLPVRDERVKAAGHGKNLALSPPTNWLCIGPPCESIASSPQPHIPRTRDQHSVGGQKKSAKPLGKKSVNIAELLGTIDRAKKDSIKMDNNYNDNANSKKNNKKKR